MRLLHELADRPAARATDLAEALGVPANSVSFHLRQMERYGFVERDTEHGSDRREKWWRSTNRDGFRLTGGSEDESAVAVARDLVRTIGAHTHAAVDEWLGVAVSDAGTSVNHDVRLHLTDAEFAQFRSELGEVWDRWLTVSRGHDDDHEDLVTFRDVRFGWTDRPAIEDEG
ncbi:ArsR family transcriptional regulator [Flexivirga caeni]|uniref:ArsR family transcriptional regulator n=2 Tax=Flexivirga caeni TaxID=2294115 RepID=A0A3M9M2R6_9MICO|nr:ArsR family transcriptional regulator [Flexivirga caeni]